MLDAAIEADALNPLPHSWKACTLGQRMFMGWDDQGSDTMSTFLETLSKANELDDSNWNTNRILAEAHLTLNDFEKLKIYATKAYKANPSNPHVLSIYGDALLRNNEIESAIKIFEKMYELEPVVASDINSDRPLQSIFFAYYLNKDFDKCIEIFNEIEEFNIRTWISLLDIYKKTDRDHLSENWYELGMKKFRDINWKNEIKSFHLSNKEIRDNFKNIASSLA
jgi:tetratricopeptide (TPR) repeat protein